MTARQFNTPRLTEALLGGALWFVGLGIIGAVTAVTSDPANLFASLGMMVFGILGASVLLTTLNALRRADVGETAALATTTIKTNRRGASKAA